MCVVSMVMDHYNERFPRDWWHVPEGQPWTVLGPGGTTTGTTVTLAQPMTEEMRRLVEEMRRLILEFKTALGAAKLVDRLTAQPDCENPEKARLEQRVAELERRLEALEPKPAARGRIKGRTRVRSTS